MTTKELRLKTMEDGNLDPRDLSICIERAVGVSGGGKLSRAGVEGQHKCPGRCSA